MNNSFFCFWSKCLRKYVSSRENLSFALSLLLSSEGGGQQNQLRQLPYTLHIHKSSYCRKDFYPQTFITYVLCALFKCFLVSDNGHQWETSTSEELDNRLAFTSKSNLPNRWGKWCISLCTLLYKWMAEKPIGKQSLSNSTHSVTLHCLRMIFKKWRLSENPIISS